MEKKYTPGPWELCGEKLKGKRDVPTFATIQGIASTAEHIHQHKHNMNLITAAPDLLEALEMARDIIEENMSQTEEMRKIYEAIAKAKGE